jgi:hypothetical protein
MRSVVLMVMVEPGRTTLKHKEERKSSQCPEEKLAWISKLKCLRQQVKEGGRKQRTCTEGERE